eukprot:TRINITY_DN1224_c0_g1_i5.p1 TRINITY_DN1224_c0_g1~~TRINITY_DN1224_c0_g1_i5.p1  ORF type:complete len:321 (-),score=83.10 TRINITY_DN1224_c0_g1_i5:1006-1968(-)
MNLIRNQTHHKDQEKMFARTSNVVLKNTRNVRSLTTAASTHAQAAVADADEGVYFEKLDNQPAVQTTQLDNGVRVVSHEDYGHLSTINILVDSGARYETKDTRGAAHYFVKNAFQSTQNRSNFGVVSALEKMGANPSVVAGRDSISINFGVPRDIVAPTLDIMADNLVNSKYSDWNLAERQAQASRDRTSSVAFVDGVHSTAFGTKNLGLPLLSKTWNNASADALKQFINDTVTGPRIVVSGSGVDHEELVAAVQSSDLAGLPSDAGMAAEAAKVEGGSIVVEGNSNLAHVCVAFEGASWTDENRIALGVLASVMGSTGG